MPTFTAWREHLAVIAYELQHQHFERAAVRDHAIRGHTARPSLLSTEDGIRNANISQWGREEVGRLWRELHHWAELDPLSLTNDWNGVPKLELQAKIEGFCAACEGRGRIDLIQDDHSHLVWQEALRRGKRFLPDFAQFPLGVFQLGGDGTMNGATSQTDITNFRNAVRFYSLSHPDKIVDGWPDNLDSTYVSQQLPPPVTVPAGAYEHEREIAARFHTNQFFVMSHDSSIAPEYVHSYRRHCEMNLLAVLRPENWDNQGIIDGMVQGQVGVSDYLVLTPNPIHEYWQSHAETAWRRGYLRYYLGSQRLRAGRAPVGPE